jgi:hypothetical protein
MPEGVTTVTEIFDLNSNGQLGWPDLLGWTFFSTVGMLGVLVLCGMFFAMLTWTTRRTVSTVRGAAHLVAERATTASRRRADAAMRRRDRSAHRQPVSGVG